MQLLCGSHVQKARSCLTKLPVARICIILRILTISCGTSFRYVLVATFGYVQISTRPRFRRLLRKSAPLFAVTAWITLCGSHVQKARSCLTKLPVARICIILRILTISCGTSFRYVLAATFGYVQISTRPRFRRLLRKSAPLFAVTVRHCSKT